MPLELGRQPVAPLHGDVSQLRHRPLHESGVTNVTGGGIDLPVTFR